MSIKKKLTVAVCVIAAALLPFSALSVAAEEEISATSLEEQMTETDSTEVYGGESVPSSSGEGSDTDEVESNVFGELYEEAMANMDKILSLLAFVSSLLVGIVYKKRLIPTLSSGIGKIGEQVASFKEGIEGEESRREEELLLMREELSSLESSTKAMSEELCKIQESLGELLPKRALEERTGIIMSAQVDLLYDVFMSSALPEYMKEDVGRRITKMREELETINEEKV